MAKPIYLQLTKPCTERWDKMTPTQQGAYCSSCNKQVIDLTAKTENEIYELVTQHNGEMCARLTQQQLNTPIRKSELVNGWFNWRAIAASLGALLAFEKTQAAGTSDSTTVTVSDHTQTNKTEPDTIPVKPNTITGIVVDSATNEPLGWALLHLENAQKDFFTDDNGFFVIDNATSHQDDTITISLTTYKTVTIPVNQFISGSAIFLNENVMYLTVFVGGIGATYINPLEAEIGPALDLTPIVYRDKPRKNKKHRTKQ